MNQFITWLMLLLVVGTTPAVIAAEGETGEVTTQTDIEVENSMADNTVTATVDAQTATEVEAMDTRSGKEMRLLQLQHQIEVKAEQARKVIVRLETGSNITADQSAELEAIADQLDALAESVDDVIANVEDQTNQETVEAFLAIKAEAKDLVAEFRANVHAIIGEEKREEVRQEVREVKAENEERVKLRIKELREEHNAVRADATLSAMGVMDAELLARIRAGELTGEELREALKTRLSEMTEEERREAAEKIREEHTKRKVARAAIIEDTKVEIRERREEMMREQIKKLEELDNEVAKQRLEYRLKILEEGGDMSEMRFRMEERIREGGVETRTEIRERMRSDGTVERRERIRTEESNSGSSDDDSDDDLEDSDDESDTRVESETEIEVEVRT